LLQSEFCTSMQFEYEIAADEFVACQLIHYKLSRGSRRFINLFSILGGLCLFFIAWVERSSETGPLLYAVIGVWWIYSGVAYFHPAWHFLRTYRKSGLAGKKFKADVNQEGFEVTSEFYSWRVRWPGVRLKGEDEQAFMFCSLGTIFMFGKKYLNDEQQRELRRLSGLSPSPPQTPKS
jgi:hypothetical protein